MPYDRNKQSSYVNMPKYMFGPSMRQQGLYDLLAQQITGQAPAMGGMGMGPTEAAMGGPLGAIMGGTLQMNANLYNQAQDAINAFTGMPSPIRKDPMKQIGAFLDQFTQRNTPMSSGPMGDDADDADDNNFEAPKMSEHEEPDEDQYGGRSDMDEDNYEDANMTPPSPAAKAARAQVDRMVAASPMASARPVGGFSSPGLASLLSGARNTQPSAMRGATPYRPEAVRDLNASISPMRMSSVPAAASMVGSRPAPSPQYSEQDYQLGDFNAPQRRRPRGYGIGGGF